MAYPIPPNIVTSNNPAVLDGGDAGSIVRGEQVSIYTDSGNPVLIDKARISSMQFGSNSAPSSATGSGLPGEMIVDANFIYVCTALNTWKRVAIATW
jgi:hypothetical protein